MSCVSIWILWNAFRCGLSLLPGGRLGTFIFLPKTQAARPTHSPWAQKVMIVLICVSLQFRFTLYVSHAR